MIRKILTFILATIASITIPCGLFMTGCSSEPQHAHTYGEVSYVWEQNDTVCVATRVCTKDPTHVQTESAVATLNTVNPSTYLLEGSGTMEATFSNPVFERQTKSVVLPKKNAITSFEGAQIKGNEIIYVVSAETTSVNFTDIISVPDDCSFAILDTYNDVIENNDTANLWELYKGNNYGYKVRITTDGGEVIYSLNIHRIMDITVYYYDQNADEILFSETITSAQEYVPNAEQVNTLAGYTFNRFVDYEYNDYEICPLYDHTYIYVDRTPKTYTITFDENAGNMAGETTEIKYNSVPSFGRPERPGCTFLGWQVNDVQITDKYGQGYYYAKWNIAEDQTVVAMWQYDTYYIEYHLDGGKNNDGNITEYLAYDDDTFELLEPTKDDVFVVNSYETAVFKAEDGSAEKLAGVDYYTNSKIRVNRRTTKFVFDGWYSDSNFENEITTLTFTYGTINLYAKWTEQAPKEEVSDVDWLIVDENGNYNPNGSYLLMGTYPQTIKSADVTIDTTLNGSNGWNVGSDGNLYKAISASPYVSQVSPATYYFSDNTKIVKNQVYYFKLEPMRWRIVNNPEDGGWGMLMADKAIDTNIYDLQGEPSYENSYLREFFLTNFYGLHFSESSKAVMVTNAIFNDLGSTKEDGIYYPKGWEKIWDSNPYVGKALNDKIYAYSASELTNPSLGFSTYFTTKDAKRTVKPTDYALAKGAAARTDGEY
ncbi:MAG: InlB B-repeat-containing protein, partial [Clostridia bacterium]|nr:InlB B-repeat-containing protein [Clostridia bacterium]